MKNLQYFCNELVENNDQRSLEEIEDALETDDGSNPGLKAGRIV